MSDLITYDINGAVTTITMDDGKVNALSPAMLAGINEALDAAEKERATVVLAGRDGRFSGGFDLTILRAGGDEAIGMLRGGFELSERLLSFPTPVVIACTGHAIAMGSFLLASADYRIGAAGDFKIAANEVAIGLTLPLAAIEILRQRLTPAAFSRATLLAETFTPDDAVAAGFLDHVAPPADVLAIAQTVAAGMAGGLHMDAHAASKLRVRAAALEAIRAGIDAEFPDGEGPATAIIQRGRSG
ncbi:MAG TPA: crotonase/enoyl-CoA hydratase family protein [Actinomycetota bacterium]|nr:crotonase/enoyl-CoA hydratase family protein [Actinomycetota bacterium]